jgi:uncharacterized membrane protein YuzA (DUF378 family)
MFITSLTLVIIGALNWFLVGLCQFDLVAWIFGGQDAIFSRVVYVLVGISGLICIGLYKMLLNRGSVD